MSSAKTAFDILPHLKALSENVLFGEVRESPELSKRDRSIATCAILAALYRTAELECHMRLALQNGVKKKELLGLSTHVACYAGWPCAMNAGRVALTALDDGV